MEDRISISNGAPSSCFRGLLVPDTWDAMRVTVASILSMLIACAQAQAGSFTKTADAMLSTGAFAGAQVGVIFISLTDGTTPYARGADVPLIPASIAKLASSAAALDMLGPDFRFKTTFLAKDKERGKKKLSTLVWRGDGDPSISGRDRSSMFEIFEIWGASFTALGVKHVKRLVVDARAFEEPTVSPHWSADDLTYWYAAETSAISFNDNCVDLSFRPGARAGAKARIDPTPDFGYLTVVNKAVTGAPVSPFTLDYRRTPKTNRVEFFGSIGATAATQTDYVAVHDPALFAAHTLRAVWKTKGPKVNKILPWGKVQLKEDELLELYSWQSPPLAQLLKVVNSNSQNFYAEQILKALGRRIEGRGSFKGGLVAVRRFLRKIGLDDSEHGLLDGSGLARANRLTARGTAKVLTRMKDVPVYVDSLAIPGVDRAARNRMKGEPLASQMRLKRGTVKGARNLAGYMVSRSGKRYAFVVLVNGPALDRPAVDANTDRLLAAAISELP